MSSPEKTSIPRRYRDPLPPEVSNDVRSAFTVFRQDVDDATFQAYTERTCRIIGSLATFMELHLPEPSYDAAALASIADHLNDPDSTHYEAAGASINLYFPKETKNYPRDKGYVATLLGDLPYLSQSAAKYRERVAEANERMPGENDEIAPNDWLDFTVGADIPEIANIHSHTNVESQLIMAADAIDRIVHNTGDDRELLDRVIRAESMHSVALEVYGFHAYDMMLQSEAGKARVRMAGYEDLLARVYDLLEGTKDAVMGEEIVDEILGVKPQEYLFNSERSSLYGENIDYSSMRFSGDRWSGQLHSRFKTVGKYALKILRNSHYHHESTDTLPSDLFGMLAVVQDAKELGVLFRQTIEGIVANDKVEFKKAASKKSPLYIQGSPDFVETVCGQLPSLVADRIQVNTIDDKPEHVYQVAKFTCELQINGVTVPVEFQFQTAADRANARLGKPSHMNHNAKLSQSPLGIRFGEPEDLYRIYNRKRQIDPNAIRVIRPSIKHGQEMRDKLERWRR